MTLDDEWLNYCISKAKSKGLWEISRNYILESREKRKLVDAKNDQAVAHSNTANNFKAEKDELLDFSWPVDSARVDYEILFCQADMLNADIQFHRAMELQCSSEGKVLDAEADLLSAKGDILLSKSQKEHALAKLVFMNMVRDKIGQDIGVEWTGNVCALSNGEVYKVKEG